MNLAFSFFIFAWVEALFSAYMGGDMLLYGSMGMISVVAKITEQEAGERTKENGQIQQAIFDHWPKTQPVAGAWFNSPR